MELLHYFRILPGGENSTTRLFNRFHELFGNLEALRLEYCFNVQIQRALDSAEQRRLSWLLAETFEEDAFSDQSFLDPSRGLIIEFGPRMSFSTAFSTNAVSICHGCGLDAVSLIARSRRYQLLGVFSLPSAIREVFLGMAHDRMTECVYEEPLRSFEHGLRPEPVEIVPLLEEGRKALEELNNRLGLAFDNRDLDYYTELFRSKLRRNPTTVECFDLAQSNSEHSRHWFFGGRLIIDGVEIPKSLMQYITIRPASADPMNISQSM